MQNSIDIEKTTDRSIDLADRPRNTQTNGRLRDRDDDNIRPINVCLIVGNSRPRGFAHENQWGFRFHRTKLFWIALIVALSVSTVYARTRYVCQSFKNEGRFYYGMDVDRCVGVLMPVPLDSIEGHLARLDASY